MQFSSLCKPLYFPPVGILILGLLLVISLSGCNRTYTYDAELLHAEQLMDDYPDSAYAILDVIPLKDRIKTAQDTALYILLLTQSRIRTGNPVTLPADTLNRPISFYRKASSSQADRRRLMLSLLYYGQIDRQIAGIYRQIDSIINLWIARFFCECLKTNKRIIS